MTTVYGNDGTGFGPWHAGLGLAMVFFLVVAVCYELADQKEQEQAKGYTGNNAPTPEPVPA